MFCKNLFRCLKKHKTDNLKIDENIPVRKIVQTDDKAVIALVVTTFDKGGLEQVVLNLYFGYKEKGYKVYLMCQENILGTMSSQIAEGDLFVFNHDLNQFLGFLYDKNITLLHYHYNVFGCREAKKRGVHLIYTMHNVYTWKSSEEILDYSRELENMDWIVPVSNFVKNYYLARTTVKDRNLRVIYNGIDLEEIESDSLPDNLQRKNLGLKASDIVIAFVASFYPVKYQIGMIGVMEKLAEKYSNVKLLFAGNSENEYYKRFKIEYDQSPAKKYMSIVPYFEHKYMGAFLRQIVDIFTLPTLQEGCSNAVLEAVCCSRPMVLTNVGNASDVGGLKSCEVVQPAYQNIVNISNEEMLQISEHKDSVNQQELVQAFETVIEKLDDYKKYADISDKEKERYGISHMIGQYIDLAEEICVGKAKFE